MLATTFGPCPPGVAPFTSLRPFVPSTSPFSLLLGDMRHPGVMYLCFGLACRPAGSFFLCPGSEPHLPRAARLNGRRGCVRARPESGVGALEDVRRTRNRDGTGTFWRRRSYLPAATAAAQSAEGTAVPATLVFESSEAVSRFRNADAGSEVWLVGCYHRGKSTVELVEDVIATVKPRVVMVELDAHRARLLPKGEAHESEDGLCWWTPETRAPDLQKKPKAGKRKPSTNGERGEQGVEFRAAAVAAQACGARVLLGDRDLEDILRRQAEARSADEKLAEKPSHKRRRAGLDMEKLEGLIARRSALGQEVAVTREVMRRWSAAMKRLRPREHAASVTERDEIMAKNLMKLEGGGNATTTVAVVGFGHLDGIETALEAEGWEAVAELGVD